VSALDFSLLYVLKYLHVPRSNIAHDKNFNKPCALNIFCKRPNTVDALHVGVKVYSVVQVSHKLRSIAGSANQQEVQYVVRSIHIIIDQVLDNHIEELVWQRKAIARRKESGRWVRGWWSDVIRRTELWLIHDVEM
jgi:hypothetical protein